MLLRMGLLLRLGPNVITDGTFITLGSTYYSCSFYRGLIQLETTYKTVTKGLDTYLITGQK